MNVLTNTEKEMIIFLKSVYSEREYYSPYKKEIAKYSSLDLRKKYELACTLRDNLTNGNYANEESCIQAEKILTAILLSITKEDLENCVIVKNGEEPTM